MLKEERLPKCKDSESAHTWAMTLLSCAVLFERNVAMPGQLPHAHQLYWLRFLTQDLHGSQWAGKRMSFSSAFEHAHTHIHESRCAHDRRSNTHMHTRTQHPARNDHVLLFPCTSARLLLVSSFFSALCSTKVTLSSSSQAYPRCRFLQCTSQNPDPYLAIESCKHQILMYSKLCAEDITPLDLRVTEVSDSKTSYALRRTETPRHL